MFFGVNARTVKNLPWKKIGSGISKGVKFTGLLMGVGGLVWFGMAAGNFALEKGIILFDYLPTELEFFKLTTETTIVIYGLILVVFLTLLGFLVDKSGQFLVQKNPFSKTK